ncbi:MAG: DNA translocase FtsK 4TM domain-containing protein [Victivallales bacterium]|nr:DNA translocase FtsK 4TM domain-containing protein [Victivallales bacterium]
MYGKEQEDKEKKGGFKLIRLVMAVLSVVLLLAILPVYSYNPEEVDYVRAGMGELTHHTNLFGIMGVYVSWSMLILFGLAAYPIALMFFVSTFRRLLSPGRNRELSFDYFVSYLVFAVGLAMLFGLWPNMLSGLADGLNLHSLPGGAIGQRLASPNGKLTLFMNWAGVLILSSVITVVAFANIIYSDWQNLFRSMGEAWKNRKDEELPLPSQRGSISNEDEIEEEPVSSKPSAPAQEPVKKPPVKTAPPVEYAVVHSSNGEYTLPGMDLLDEWDVSSSTLASEKEIDRNKKILQATLSNFKIDATVQDAVPGPQVTLYEIKTAPGLKLSAITQLESNFRMDLAAQSLRILAPIPGRELVGMEIPNEKRAVVPMRSLLQDKAWTSGKEQIPLLLGKDISNKTQILDLAKAPHVLVAGTTGSGKSVCMNLLIESMLFKFGPDQLRFIMVDPKVVEFQVYSTLPHLITPVINDAADVPLALNWAINEMERRYRVLAKVGAKDIATFNKRPPLPEGAEPILDENGDPIPQTLPFIVIIIDELADIMLVAKSEVENKLSRIAAKSRAVGIHTIIATQRPDTHTLTGTIKANFPVRIAFKTASVVDSQTIIGGKGAESLLGMGDMLFIPPGASDIKRIQCGMASDDERNRVAQFVSAQAEQHFDDSVMRRPEEVDADGEDGAIDGGGNGGEGSLFQKAVQVILTSKRPTVSYLQRSLGIGYNKAASLMEELEERGVVGPQVGTAPRQILITSADDISPED